MKTVFSVSFVLFLVGCSVVGAVYDTNEYAAFTNIATVANLGKSSCGNKDSTKIVADQVKNVTTFAIMFTKHEPYNVESYKISQEIDKLANEFKNAAQDEMTAGYCSIKLDSIQHAAEVAMQASASKRRQ